MVSSIISKFLLLQIHELVATKFTRACCTDLIDIFSTAQSTSSRFDPLVRHVKKIPKHSSWTA